MSIGWFLSPHVSRFFLWSVILLFLLSEAMVIASALGSNRMNSPSEIGKLLGSMLVMSVPAAAGIKGYYAARRLEVTLEEERHETTIMWMSRQFLVAAIFGYSAIISNIVFLTEVVFKK